eukprot:TRINITY_DN5651_c0_g1_i14.p1 TRINITY_DN5651_c0_g1~~TRINITY_DN5651_c0_g1_i14.p1  ORF type:complete len:178 (-),score=24.51 TRINITY_DN5651_c0_g1_i14:88-621(-)
MDVQPLKFLFYSVDEPNWPHVRAVRVLSDFVRDDRCNQKIDDIISSHGRFIMLFDNRKSMVVFDPVPNSRDLRILYYPMDILLQDMKGSPTPNEKPPEEILFGRFSSPVVMVQLIPCEINFIPIQRFVATTTDHLQRSTTSEQFQGHLLPLNNFRVIPLNNFRAVPDCTKSEPYPFE